LSLSLKPGQGIAGRVARSGVILRTDDAEAIPQFERAIARKIGVSVKGVLCVPIPGDGAPLGALELINKAGGFDEADERLATLLAGQTGRAIAIREERDASQRKARLATIGQMLSGVLHDLRSPMTVISGYTQLLAGERDTEQRKTFAAIIEREFDHINAMTRETLAFARGERQLLLRKVHLNALAEEVDEHLRAEAQRTGVAVKVEAGYAGIARIDDNKIKRALYNLARNAIQAMPDGGTLTLTISQEGDDLVFRVADTGAGVPPEIADRIFESFVTAGKKDGTGLGLAIVKQAAEEHGGTVSFKSRPGKGTTFELRLPGATAKA
jgi:signal transduction histidine kinase